MKLLLDTHAAIWSVSQTELLPKHIALVISDNISNTFVSSITIVEISIKYKLQRRDSPPFNGTDAISHFKAVGFQLLPVTPEHAAAVDKLPLYHKDPFDRLIVAQAISEPMYLVSKDALIAAYDCPRLDW